MRLTLVGGPTRSKASRNLPYNRGFLSSEERLMRPCTHFSPDEQYRRRADMTNRTSTRP